MMITTSVRDSFDISLRDQRAASFANGEPEMIDSRVMIGRHGQSDSSEQGSVLFWTFWKFRGASGKEF